MAKSLRRRIAPYLLALTMILGGGDLFWPLHRDLRQFDPVAVAALETRMWQAYYDRKPLALFLELAEALRTQYHFPWLRSWLGAWFGASAAFSFKDGKGREDYERALPALRNYFALIRNTDEPGFDVQRAATLELEWWIAHRQRDRYGTDAIGQACAEAAALLYGLPVSATLKHGRLRAAAMAIRDAREETGGLTDADWDRINGLLKQSYQSLQQALLAAGLR